MIYKIRRCSINNDGTVTDGKRTQIVSWPCELKIGGLFFLRRGKLARVLAEIKPGF